MKKGILEKGIFVGLIITALIFFSYWMAYNPVKEFTASVPGLDKRPARSASDAEVVMIGAKFEEYASFTPSLTGKWTRFRGADFDNISKENIPLINNWVDGPKILWEKELGEGHSAPVIYNGKAYILDYIEAEKVDALRCFALESGTELWRRWYDVHVKRNHGMSRTVPAITDKYLITIGPKCHVMCVNPTNGELLWSKDLVREYATEIPFWYTGQCPLIDNDIAIIAPGGKSLLIGIDCSTGMVVWKTPNPDAWNMSHSSIMPMTFNGKKMYVYHAVGGIVGISAEGEDVGKILWKSNVFSPNVVAPSPIILDDGMIYTTAGYGAGACVFQLTESNNIYDLKVLKKYKPKEGMACEQQSPVLYKGKLFGIQPNDAGTMRNQFICVDPSNTQEILWTSGKEARFGLGPYMVADNKFFILKDDGTLFIVDASTTSFKLLDKTRITDGHDAWGPLAIADGFLLMRDSKKMVCLDVRAK